MEAETDQEPWIEPSLDGTGGGYGKYRGMTVRDIGQLFDGLAKEPNARNASAVLRIAYEQLEGRSHLAVSTYSAGALGVVTVLLAAAYPFFSDLMRAYLLKAIALSAVLFAGFLSGAIHSRHQAKAAFAQEKAICRVAAYHLDRIASAPGFTLAKLDHVQSKTLRTILKKSQNQSPALRKLLDR